MKKPGPDSGFSLVELLVAVAVMSILAIGATLTLARVVPVEGVAGTKLSGLASELRLKSILSGRPHSLVLGHAGWRAERLGTRGGWETLPGLASGGGLRVTVLQGGEGVLDEPGSSRVLFLPDGQVSPIRFILQGDSGGLHCADVIGSGLSCSKG